MPDITGTIQGTRLKTSGTGAFKQSTGGNTGAALDTTGAVKFYANNVFYASDSNAIYGKSSTVQPPAIIFIPQLKY